MVTDCIKDPLIFEREIATQQSLIKYMILSIPLFGSHIELIIESTLEFYHTNQMFMLNFWTSLGQLAQISETEASDETHNRGLKDLVA
jgi:hypothetical protein